MLVQYMRVKLKHFQESPDEGYIAAITTLPKGLLPHPLQSLVTPIASAGSNGILKITVSKTGQFIKASCSVPPSGQELRSFLQTIRPPHSGQASRSGYGLGSR
jgi:hypothetical protein